LRPGCISARITVRAPAIRLVRTGLELTVLLTGWLLGGTVGVGTVLFAVAIGALVQFFLPLFDVRDRSRRPTGEAVTVSG
jgi:uncharacterized membrane protein YczE